MVDLATVQRFARYELPTKCQCPRDHRRRVLAAAAELFDRLELPGYAEVVVARRLRRSSTPTASRPATGSAPSAERMSGLVSVLPISRTSPGATPWVSRRPSLTTPQSGRSRGRSRRGPSCPGPRLEVGGNGGHFRCAVLPSSHPAGPDASHRDRDRAPRGLAQGGGGGQPVPASSSVPAALASRSAWSAAPSVHPSDPFPIPRGLTASPVVPESLRGCSSWVIPGRPWERAPNRLPGPDIDRLHRQGCNC